VSATGCQTVAAPAGPLWAGPLPKHSAVATRTVRDTLKAHGCESAGCYAEVRRRNGGLVIEIVEPNVESDPNITAMAAIRASGAVRALDRWARGIDVTVRRQKDRVVD
jgi:hypothetical protein